MIIPIILGVIFYYQWKIGLILTVLFIIGALIWCWPNIMTLMGQRHYANGNIDKALKFLKAGHENWRSKATNSATYGYILLRCGRCDEAKKILNFALLNKKLPEDDKNKLREIMSLVYYKTGDILEAEELLNTVFQSYKNSSVYGSLGYYKILLKREDAYDFCAEAYEYNSDDKIIIDNMILAELDRGNTERAKELSDKTTEAGNKGVEIYYHAGLIEEKLGNNEKALEYYQMAQSCRRSFMTTVSDDELEKAIERLSK